MCLECGKPLQTSADKARRRCVDCPAPYDEELFERLRAWRTERAREEEIAAFMVFSNATLEEIATRRPQSPRALLAVSGVGREKLQKYGEDLLDLVG
jgi:DNA helicase-2/ATP-dependent DNA helicase PcrA